MQLSKRLEALASMVTKGRTVADVGCDHAYVSIYLMQQSIANSVIAMDINKGPIKKAKENIEANHLSVAIETRLSNGLMELQPGEVDTILIAGMGGSLIVEILSAREDVVEQVQELILSPHSEVFLVREYLRTHDFVIQEEKMVKEDGKYYTMIKALRRKDDQIEPEVHDSFTQRLFDCYGKYLLEQKNAVLNEFLHVELRKRQKIRKQLIERSQDYGQRLQELDSEIKILEGGLSYYAM